MAAYERHDLNGDQRPLDEPRVQRSPALRSRLGGKAFAAILLACAVFSAAAATRCAGQQFAAPKTDGLPGSPSNLTTASFDLRLFPRDAYRQYVVLQLLRRAKTPDALYQHLPQRMTRGRDPREVDLFSLFSGSLAVQESLQTERLLANFAPGFERERPAVPAPTKVKISSLEGPTIMSHPWEAMLAGRQPEISPLARCVPADFYFIEFRSLNKLVDLAEHSDLWGRHFFSQADQSAQSHQSLDRLKRQLAIETSNLARPFYDTVVSEVAITGSDLFFQEGSDVTLLFRHKSAEVFQTQMDLYLTKAEKNAPGATRRTGEYLGVKFVHITSPHRDVHVFSANPQPDLHVRGNSWPSFQRVLAAIKGQDEQGADVPTLGDTTEFAFIRTLMPRGAAEEDGFIYLSDPFIRQLVGPRLKLTARRRSICSAQLRMAGHASLFYRAEHGRAPRSYAEIAAAECSPGTFGEGHLACPDGGTYSLSSDGMTSTCSHHGESGHMVPCCEIPLETANSDEVEQYQRFLMEYNQYWRTFFDPIAIRIQATPERYRAETIVLPLLDNSIYTGLARFTGGKVEALDSLPVPPRNIFSLALHLDKQAIAAALGLPELVEPQPDQAANAERDQRNAAERESQAAAAAIAQIGLALHNYHDVYRRFPPRGGGKQDEKPRLSWRVALLPFLDQAKLYEQFHHDEPWDSEHNRKLIAQMPAAFRSADAKLNAEGKTRFVAPVGKGTVFPPDQSAVSLASILDGTSNTIMGSIVKPEHAVVWTKPDDWETDAKAPLEKLAGFRNDSILLLFCDGSVRLAPRGLPNDTFRRIATRNDGEPIDAVFEPVGFRAESRTPFGWLGIDLNELELAKFLAQGIGDSVGFHVYDAPQMFSLSLPQALGMFAGMGSVRGRLENAEVIIPATLLASLNAPVYFSIPVRDAKIVDEFLEQLDGLLAWKTRTSEEAGFISIVPEFYRLTLPDGRLARCATISVGPVKWRLSWARIGRGLYVASQNQVLSDLALIDSGKAPAAKTSPVEPCHAMLRLRPENWREVVPHYQLGWAEQNRAACLNNLGPLQSVAGALTNADPEGAATQQKPAEAGHPPIAKPLPPALEALVSRIYGVRCYCPEGGVYQMAGENIECSKHGSVLQPRQAAQPSDQNGQTQSVSKLRDALLSLKFLEDGLHATIIIERK